jgi:homoserine O-acetyltransferase/O-succinyltransferase
MAGERMRLDGFTEISAVCVHPSGRGQGLAAELVSTLVRSIVSRGETPFLHVFNSNRPAIELYLKLGFVLRRPMHLALLARASDDLEHLRAILGMSMGGMNAWQWAEAYPDAMDGIMPVVSLPIPVSGRNLLWRRMVIDDIRSDPEWQGGNYTSPPNGWFRGFTLLRMMIDGVPHLQALVPGGAAADRFIEDARKEADSIDPNDNLYSLESSRDYDPRPNLESIKTKVFALNFADDEFNPSQLHILDRLMPKVLRGRFMVQAGSETSYGHLTMAHPELWSQHVAEFMHDLGDASPQK